VIAHTGRGFTVKIISSVAVPQLGVVLLVVVKRSVTVPVPATLTVEVNELALFIEATAVPVEANALQTDVPFAAVPAKVNAVGPEGAVWHFAWSGPALAVGFAFTVKITSSVTVPQLGVALLVLVKRSVTVPIPATLTVEVNELVLLIVAAAVPVDPIALHTAVPFAAVPAKVNEVGPEGAVWHLVSSGPALTVGFAFTVNTTSSVAFPQLGVTILVLVKRSVTVPIPATLTVEVNEPVLFIVAAAVPVEAIALHTAVPFATVPAKVNEVGPEGAVWHLVSSGPALTVGFAFTNKTSSSAAVPQLGVASLVVVRRTVTVPIPTTLTVEVNEPGLFIVATAVPVEAKMLHTGVPFDALPAKVNKVGPEGGV
jgi:Na+-transporting NADH:ubiquinone oxidoreductase subunit NqrB